MTGKPIRDFENLDFKIASGLRKIQTGNFKNNLPQPKAKLNQWGDHWRPDRLLGLSTTSLVLVGTMKSSWTSEICRKCNCRTTTFKPSTQSGTKCYQKALTDPDNTLESLYKMQVGKSEVSKYLLQVCAQETTFGDKKYGQAENQRFWLQSGWQTCNRSFEQRKSERKRQRQCQKQFGEWRLHTFGSARCNFGDKCFFTKIQLHLLKRRKIHQLLQCTSRRMMNARSVRGKCSRMTILNSEWDSIVSQKGTTLEVIQTGSQNLQIFYAPKLLERSIECTLRMEEMEWKSAWTLHKDVCKILIFRILKTNMGSSNRVPRAVFLHHLWELQMRENESLWTQELHFIWWIKMTWLRRSKKQWEKSKDPSVIMTATGPPRRQNKQQCMSVIWTCLVKFKHWKNHPLGIMWEENMCSYEWHPSQPSCDLNSVLTTTAASDVTDSHDERQLTSPMFSQVTEVSANPFSTSVHQ